MTGLAAPHRAAATGDGVESSPIDAVVFDLGGVLIDWNPRHLYRRLIADEQEMEHFLATVCTMAWNLELDGGRPFAEAVAALQREHPHRADLIEAYHRRWPEMLAGAIEPSVSVLADLVARRTPVYGLTNWSAETFGEARRRFPFLAWFDGIVVSGEEGVVKPDRRIFTLLLERYALAAERTVFVDDSSANVEAASAVGMHGIVFTSGPALRASLARLGLVGGQPARTLGAAELDRDALGTVRAGVRGPTDGATATPAAGIQADGRPGL